MPAYPIFLDCVKLKMLGLGYLKEKLQRGGLVDQANSLWAEIQSLVN